MANIPENLFHMDANEIKEPIKAERINKQPKPKAIPDCKVIVNPESVLFNPIQIGTRDVPTQFMYRDNMIGLDKAAYLHSNNMFIQRYEVAPDNVVLRLISFNTPVAQVSSKGDVEVIGYHISNATSYHIIEFMEAVGIERFTFPSLAKCYGVKQLSAISVYPVLFPRVTIGMLNRGIKATTGNDNIRVDSKTFKVFRILNNGNLVYEGGGGNLREAMRCLIQSGYLDYNYILEANKPENIMKFYRS